MDYTHAKEILAMLADGVNPTTGELLSENDTCNQPDIIRALHVAVMELEKAEKRASKALPENSGKPWTPEDEDALLRMYRQGASKKELCEYFKRTSGGIAARLVRLGVIQSRDEFRYKA